MPAKVVKKRAPRKPSLRQEIATSIVMENRGEIAISRAMEMAGYPPVTAKNPKNLTESDYYQNAMEELRRELNSAQFTPASVAQNVSRISFTAKKRDQFSGEMYEDNAKQLDAMKFGSELMGWLKPDSGNTNNTQNNFYFDWSD